VPRSFVNTCLLGLLRIKVISHSFVSIALVTLSSVSIKDKAYFNV